ncbi:MAG: aldo/keto reductase [Rikenellaceae bacterium]|jgi:L-glyceraldehyde 3-phosphate reductase|nr:aldo/keto reductase [Rikenellaceae bacterium]
MEENYTPSPERYLGAMKYRRCGQSGVILPEISLGLWHNFGGADDPQAIRRMVFHAFDRGITHFDLANNYGPPPGSAEENFGRILRDSLASHRHELFISTKAGHEMWPGPYGDGGSRKNLMTSLDESLFRMKLDYVDLFYSHRYDPDTPLQETMQALVDIVRQGKALYVGISKYPPQAAAFAYDYLCARDVPCLIYQGRYNLLEQTPETSGLLSLTREAGAGFAAFSPLAQGLLSGRYLAGAVPADSRMARGHFLKQEALTPELLYKIRALDAVAQRRGQTLAEMALAWLLRREQVTTVIIGASSTRQMDDNLRAIENSTFTDEELAEIDLILQK